MIRRSDSLLGTNLNSVWLEGTLVGAPVGLPDDSGRATVRFQIRDHRPLDSAPPSIFDVEASGPAISGLQSRLAPGHQVRIIGRLNQKNHAEVFIVGELVEALGP